MSTTPTTNPRLPSDVTPTHYVLTICTDVEKLEFSGTVTISLDVVKETSVIVLNMADISIGRIHLSSNTSTGSQEPSEIHVDPTLERVSLKFATLLPAGSKATLNMTFKKALSNNSTGYYKSSWRNDGHTVNYALTQFEPIAARHAFPCWDEPSLKATFDVTMISRRDSLNLSNMPIVSEEHWGPHDTSSFPETINEGSADDWKITRFETTPPMSTYLLAWANGPFGYIESSYTSLISGKTRPLRVYTTSDVLHQANFVLDTTAKVIPAYEKMFDIEYPLPKLDTLIVDDFDADAMENWGLIIGKKDAFLLDPELADVATKKRVATMQGHEIAHMWFGNITTMEWWNYLYLNEGFATLMGELFIVERIMPEWKADSEFITVFLDQAFNLDAKPSSHPIEVDCPTAGDIVQIFDLLSYSKAASVLRMLSNYVGEQAFLEGVSLYLKRRLYGNSVSRDLWNAIGEVTGLQIAGLMENWVSKTGFPVVSVTEDWDGIHVRQSRFWESGPVPEEDPTLWVIPLCVSSLADDGNVVVERTSVLDERETVLTVRPDKFLKLNADTTGVFRTLYKPERFLQMADAIEHKKSKLTVNDRIGLIHDVVALGLAGYVDMSVALAVMHAFRNEKDYLVWGSITTGITKLRSIFWENPAIARLLDDFCIHLYGPLVQKLGTSYSLNEALDTTILRTNAIEQAALAGHEGIVSNLRKRFASWMNTHDDAHIPADLMRATYATAVRYGGEAEHQFVKSIIPKAKTPTSATAAMYALCSAKDSHLIKKTFDMLLDEVRDVPHFFEGLQSNPKTRRALVEFFKVHYDEIYARYKNNFCLKYLIEFAFNALSSKEDCTATRDWFQDKDTSKYHLALCQSLDAINARAACIERSSSDVLQWLQSWQVDNARSSAAGSGEPGTT